MWWLHLAAAIGHEPMTALKLFFLLLIVIGSVGLQLIG